jgi:predicted amidohydrolase
LAARGARLIVCPSNNMMTREKAEKYRHLHNKVRAQRSKETGLWLISSDVVGEKGNQICYGPTAIINPAGEVVSQVPLLEAGMIVGEID